MQAGFSASHDAASQYSLPASARQAQPGCKLIEGFEMMYSPVAISWDVAEERCGCVATLRSKQDLWTCLLKNWKLETGNWKLKTGNWKHWKLERGRLGKKGERWLQRGNGNAKYGAPRSSAAWCREFSTCGRWPIPPISVMARVHSTPERASKKSRLGASPAKARKWPISTRTVRSAGSFHLFTLDIPKS
eukprot:scaffold106_cov246-Pinguiococcus_pyrenoidosus.AAC.19